MRRLLLLAVLMLGSIVALGRWYPGATYPLPTITSQPPTPLPDDFTLLPAFTPSYPCELQVVDVHDDDLCRSESISERLLLEGDGVSFIAHDYHVGMGCWTSINQDIHELRVCNRSSGAVETITRELVTGLAASPDNAWLAFGIMSQNPTSGIPLEPHLYRIRPDGTGLQQLDTQPFPDEMVGAPAELRWLDDQWLAFRLWDGSGEDGWHPFRLKADGSGDYAAL